MKVRLSLQQIWTLIVLFAVITPVVILMSWYGTSMYKNQLNSALTIEHQANEFLKNQIESELRRFKTIIKNKSDAFLIQVNQLDNPESLKQIYSLMRVMRQRETAIRGVMLLSEDAGIIAVVDSAASFPEAKILSAEEKRTTSENWWGQQKISERPEVIIPSLGRTYIGSLKHHEGDVFFTIAIPISQPVKAIFIIKLDARKLLQLHTYKESATTTEKTRHYILDRRGSLITNIVNSDYKSGELMTHLAITRTALIGAKWPTDVSYIGVNNHPVYGTLTTIPSLNWTLISEISVERIMQPIWASLQDMFMVTLLGLTIFILLVLRLAKKSLKPMKQACKAIDQVAKGDYGYHLKSMGIREFDEMATGINHMAEARMLADKALQESEQDLIITLNSIGDAVITCDKQGCVTRMNPVAQKLTGWSIEESRGLPIKSVFSIVNASTLEPIPNPVDKVLSTGETVYLSNHTTLIAKDGSEYQIADSAAPIRNGDDTILGMVLVFNDVTEQYQLRKQAKLAQQTLINKEKEQREVLDSMYDAVISIDESGAVLSANKSAENLFGYPFEEIKGRNVNYLMPEPFASEHDGYLRNYFETGEARVIGLGREVKGKRKNQEIFPMRLFVAELPRSADGKRCFVGSCVDLTNLKQQEEQLKRSQKMDALGKLTGGVAHDYNNMLGVVLGYSELLESELSKQPKLANYANRITQAGQRGAKLTNKLLSFSKQESTDADSTNINTLICDMQHMLEKTLTVRIKLTLDLEDNLWPVWLSSADMEDVILNMAINAMHAIDGNGTLTIQSQNSRVNRLDAGLLGLSEPGDYIRLAIKDTGCGMNQATKDKIFDPFFSTKGDKGTGLGLSQAYGFAERCDGAIKVYSELNKGSEFVFYIPRYFENSSENTKMQNTPKLNFKGEETVLVVDDEQALLILNREILSNQNYTVYTADSAKQALKILQTESIDLLLSDVLMPEMDGFQLAAIVQKKYPHIKIQLASGFSDNKHTDLVDDNLQKNLLHKPFNSQKLLQRIRQLLDGDEIQTIKNITKIEF